MIDMQSLRVPSTQNFMIPSTSVVSPNDGDDLMFQRDIELDLKDVMALVDQDDQSGTDINSTKMLTLEIEKILSKIGHEKHLESFIQNEIDYPMFLNLEDSDLKDIGIKALGSRKKILAAIKECKMEQSIGT